MKKKISASRINAILKDCIAKEGEEAVAVSGIIQSFALNEHRLEKYRNEMIEIIQLLNSNFFTESEDGAGGASFIHLALDKYGNQWGEQKNAEELVVLALGLGLCKRVGPMSMDREFPGGVPYFVFSFNF